MAVILPWNSYAKHLDDQNNFIEYYILRDSIEKNPILK